MRLVLRIAAFVGLFTANVFGQSGFDDDRVMLQGFYWESYRHGDPDPRFARYGSKKWYQIVQEQAEEIRDGRFDLIWLPPPSYAGLQSAGYNPKQYWKLDNSYGDQARHRAMLETLLQNGIEPIADIVINHRDGNTGWVDFKNPDWGLNTITRNDEAFTNSNSPVFNTPVSLRGADEEKPTEYATTEGTTYAYSSFRDLDHTNPQVRRDIIKYLLQLRSFGYRGWRYDMVHGYHAKRVANYNKRSNPSFSVGEYDWDKQSEQRGWVWWTSTNPGLAGVDHLRASSSVFDFSTQFQLKDNKGRYDNWYGNENGFGLIGDSTDRMPWKNRCVTFLENHDTGFRTDDDGNPEKGHQINCFQNGWEVEQGYAYILTHPGVPCVFWKHYFDWGESLKQRIKAIINARKIAGIHSGSGLFLQQNAKDNHVYAARVVGSRGDLYVRIGGDDNSWQPSFSNYSNYQEYASGENWKVWVAISDNPTLQQAPHHEPFEVPAYVRPESIDVPDEWLDVADP